MSLPPWDRRVRPVDPDGPVGAPPSVRRAVGLGSARYVELDGAGADGACLLVSRIDEAVNPSPISAGMREGSVARAALAYLGPDVESVRVRAPRADVAALARDASLPGVFAYGENRFRVEVDVLR